MIHIFDAAVCPDTDTLQILRDQRVMAGGGYLGGAAQHVWTTTEWRRLQQSQILPLPIWVAPYESWFHEMGAIAGNAALDVLQSLHLTSLVVLDVEEGYQVGVEYVRGFGDALRAGDCDLALYAVSSDLRYMGPQVPHLFTWAANPGAGWTFLGDDTMAWQYAFHPFYDLSVADNTIPTAKWSGDL